MKREISTLQKNDIVLVEYSDPTFTYDDSFFLRCTCVGFYMTKQQLRDLHSVLNYYINIEDFMDVEVKIGEDPEDVSDK
jgi:hypothetical protein